MGPTSTVKRHKLCEWVKKEAVFLLCISHKIDLKLKLTRRDKEGHFVLIKRTINQETLTILYMYTSNSGPSNLTVGDFYTPLSLILNKYTKLMLNG